MLTLDLCASLKIKMQMIKPLTVNISKTQQQSSDDDPINQRSWQLESVPTLSEM